MQQPQLNLNDPMVQQCMQYLINQMNMSSMNYMNPQQFQNMYNMYMRNMNPNFFFMNPMQLNMMYQNYLQMSQQQNQNRINPNVVGGNVPNPSPIVNNPNYYNQQRNQDDLVELLPREDKTIAVPRPSSSQSTPFINITLNASTGLKVVVPISPTSTVQQLFLTYAQKVGIPVNALGSKIIFLFGGGKIDINSQQQIGNVFKNGAVVTVFDQGGIIGA
jgi:hypothetical protein